MIYVLVLVTFYYIDGVHEEGSICQVREEDFDARFMKKLKSPWENIYSKTEVDELLNKKQNTLIEGTGIDIDEDDEISCTVEPSAVTVTQVQTTGTKIATIDVDGVDTDIYAPEGGSGLAEDVIADEFDTTPIVTPGTAYAQYDIVKKDSHYYYAKQATSTSWVASEWQDAGTSITDVAPKSEWETVQIDSHKIIHDTNVSKYIINTGDWAQSYSEGSGVWNPLVEGDYKGNYNGGSTSYHQYSTGDFCMHEGGLYKCTGSTTGQSWNSSKWSATQVTDELGGGGSGGGTTVIEVWYTPNSPDPQPQLASSIDQVIGAHVQCDFKVNGTAQTYNQIKALLEAGTCVLKTSNEISTLVGVKTSYAYGLTMNTTVKPFWFVYSSGYWIGQYE